MGRKYWEGLIRWMEQTLIEEGTISAADMNMFYLADHPRMRWSTSSSTTGIRSGPRGAQEAEPAADLKSHDE